MKNRSLFSYLRSHEKPQAEKRNPHSSFFILHSSFNKTLHSKVQFPQKETISHIFLVILCNMKINDYLCKHIVISKGKKISK